MKKMLLAGVLAAAAVPFAPSAHAQTYSVQVIGAGSSALFNVITLGAFNAAGGEGHALHYTTKGTCTGTGTSGNCAEITDQRPAAILPEGGNLSVIWNPTTLKVWALVSVDSVVGNRSFFAVPRAALNVNTQNEQGNAGNPQNLLTAALYGAGDPGDQQTIPTAVYTAIAGTKITAALTDIRPEDAKFASDRVLAPLDPVNYTGLGYNTGTAVGTPIKSFFTSSQANPVDFALPGNPDPITGQTVPADETYSIGASPVILIVNKSNPAGLGAPGLTYSTSVTKLHYVYEGLSCLASTLITGAPKIPVNVTLREPLSGTMNTFEFTNIRIHPAPGNDTASQEYGVNPAQPNNNPLHLACANNSGFRNRAIGTGEVVKNAVQPNADTVGYIFFSFGATSSIANSSSYTYLSLGGPGNSPTGAAIDPTLPFATGPGGNLPSCNNPCPISPNTSFPNLRNGKYRSWSVLRAVGDPLDGRLQNLITNTDNIVNSTVPDFVPFRKNANGDNGLPVYRSHYLQEGVPPNNGITNPAQESGGDVGGCIESKANPNVLNCEQ